MCPDCSEAHFKSAALNTRICRQCGESFQGGPRAWYCPSCRMERKRKRDTEYHRAGYTPRKLGSLDKCQICDTEYVVKGGRQRYCDKCRDAAVAENTRQRSREYYIENKERISAVKAESRSIQKVCAVCGKPFSSDVPTVTCSPECHAIKKRMWQEIGDFNRGHRKAHPEIKKPKGEGYE